MGWWPLRGSGSQLPVREGPFVEDVGEGSMKSYGGSCCIVNPSTSGCPSKMAGTSDEGHVRGHHMQGCAADVSQSQVAGATWPSSWLVAWLVLGVFFVWFFCLFVFAFAFAFLLLRFVCFKGKVNRERKKKQIFCRRCTPQMATSARAGPHQSQEPRVHFRSPSLWNPPCCLLLV